MKRYLTAYLLLLILFTASCKKNDVNGNTTLPEPIITPKGLQVGAPVTKIIGNSGGELHTAV